MALEDHKPVQPPVEDITHSGNFTPAPERHPTDDFQDTTLAEATEQGLIQGVPDSLATMPDVIAAHYNQPAVIPPEEHRFPRIEVETSKSWKRPILAAGFAVGVLVTGLFALKAGSSDEQTATPAAPKVSTTLLADEVTPSTLSEVTPETEVPQGDEYVLYGEPLVSNTAEEWLQTLNNNMIYALNTGDVRYIEHAYSETISLETQEQNIAEFQAEKERVGAAYMILSNDVISINSQNGFDDPNAQERSFTATTRETYQRYIGDESTFEEESEYVLVKQVLVYRDKDRGVIAEDTWVIKSATTTSRELIN